MKKILLLLSFTFVLISCESQSSKDIVFKQEFFQGQSDVNCQEDNCTSIEIDVPVIINAQHDIKNSINQATLATIVDLMSFETDLNNINTYQSLVSAFLDSYEDFVKQYPDESMPWKATVKANNTFINDSLYALKIDYYTFAGGAYGYQNSIGLLFDLQDAQILTPDKLFTNWPKVMPLIESKINYGQQLKDNKGILAYPEQIFIHNDKIVFAYFNEVNFPVSQQPDYIEFPLQEIAPYLAYNVTPLEIVYQK
ncbi:PdaC/SigV domain-containing protein [Myroides sp. LJL119]